MLLNPEYARFHVEKKVSTIHLLYTIEEMLNSTKIEMPCDQYDEPQLLLVYLTRKSATNQ